MKAVALAADACIQPGNERIDPRHHGLKACTEGAELRAPLWEIISRKDTREVVELAIVVDYGHCIRRINVLSLEKCNDLSTQLFRSFVSSLNTIV